MCACNARRTRKPRAIMYQISPFPLCGTQYVGLPLKTSVFNLNRYLPKTRGSGLKRCSFVTLIVMEFCIVSSLIWALAIWLDRFYCSYFMVLVCNYVNCFVLLIDFRHVNLTSIYEAANLASSYKVWSSNSVSRLKIYFAHHLFTINLHTFINSTTWLKSNTYSSVVCLFY